MSASNRKINLLVASLLTMPFLNAASSTTPFVSLGGDVIGMLSKEKDKTYKVSLRPISSGSYYFSIYLTNSIVSNYKLFSTDSGHAMKAYTYTYFTFTIPAKYVANEDNVFKYRIDGVSGNYTGKTLRYSVSINAGETHVMEYEPADCSYVYGPYYIHYSGGAPVEASVCYLLETAYPSCSDSRSNKVSQANYYFKYQNEAGANVLSTSYQAELRLYDHVNDFELGYIVSEKGVSYRKFPLVVEASGYYDSFATYKFHLAPHLVSRKNLVMSEGNQATSSQFVSTDFYIPSGFRHVGENFTFEVILSDLSENLDQIRMNFTFYHSHEQFGSFYDGDYVVRIGGANG